jgi:hypothetical protein
MSTTKASTRSIKHVLLGIASLLIALATVTGGIYLLLPQLEPLSYSGEAATTTPQAPAVPPLDLAAYDARLLALAHVASTSLWYEAFMAGTTTLTLPGGTTTVTVEPKLWPARAAVPADGRALLPFNRIVAYYGNFYSTGMGVLGQYDEDEVISKLNAEVEKWEAADPATPVIPAIEYIDVTAQGSAGKDGTYRARMPDDQIDKALEYASRVGGIVILDIQVGLSTLPDELPLIKTYLAMPNVHLAIDPEFSMKDRVPPGREIGTFSAADINYAINFLSDIVKENNLPPKVLIVHRFTEEMVTGYQNIAPTPQVEVVMNMDGWGYPEKKLNTYNAVIEPEPVQFTGIKLFYKNDLLPPSTSLLSTTTILNLTPAPVYIQYQ